MSKTPATATTKATPHTIDSGLRRFLVSQMTAEAVSPLAATSRVTARVEVMGRIDAHSTYILYPTSNSTNRRLWVRWTRPDGERAESRSRGLRLQRTVGDARMWSVAGREAPGCGLRVE